MGKHFKNRYNEVDEANIIDDYVNGKKSCYVIGWDYDMSASAIRLLLMRNNIQLRAQGRQKTKIKTIAIDKSISPTGNDRISYEKIVEGISQYTNNKFSLSSLAIFWNCSVSSARKILIFHNVQRHNFGWRENNDN